MAGESTRLRRMFRADGRAVVVAMDGARGGPAPGLEHPREIVRSVVSGGADAIMTTFGMARDVSDVLGTCGLILALDSEGPVADWGVEAAIRLGADAVELKARVDDVEGWRMADLRRLAAECQAWGMPLLAEMLAASWEVALDDAEDNVDLVARAARVGAEAGADFVKVHYVGPAASYRRVVDQCYVPVLVMGGPRRDEPVEVLQMAHDAMEAGASGVVFGRNVVSHPHPGRMVAALARIVHEGVCVAEAARELEQPHSLEASP